MLIIGNLGPEIRNGKLHFLYIVIVLAAPLIVQESINECGNSTSDNVSMSIRISSSYLGTTAYRYEKM